MKRRLSGAVWLVVVAGCGAGAPQPAMRADVLPRASAATRETAVVAVEGAEASGLLDVAPGPDPTAAFRGELPEPCAGPEVYLTRLGRCHCGILRQSVDEQGNVVTRASMSCGEGFYGRDLTRYLEASLSAEKARVVPGERVMLTLAFRNVTNKDLGLVFRRSFLLLSGMGSVPEVVVLDARGNDMTFAGECGTGVGGDHGHYLVVIAPGGRAMYRREWEASTMVGRLGSDGSCNYEGHPLPKGTYTLRMRAPFEDSQALAEGVREVMGTIEVVGE